MTIINSKDYSIIVDLSTNPISHVCSEVECDTVVLQLVQISIISHVHCLCSLLVGSSSILLLPQRPDKHWKTGQIYEIDDQVKMLAAYHNQSESDPLNPGDIKRVCLTSTEALWHELTKMIRLKKIRSHYYTK